ncbi:MAG: flap structure-specific endonuclease [Thermoplasmata archaeon]|nr:flap structure-specific endonuclease [Thermoplasmata archaeon]
MGLPLRDITHPTDIPWSALAGRTLAVDGNNMLYQFLATIRGGDGRPFTDRAGRVTAHLIGLLYRTTSWLEQQIRPVWVFDGRPPELKAGTLRTRFLAKERAQKAWDDALAAGDLATARKKAAQTSRLTQAMIGEATQVLAALGLPTVQAPSEGEAQGARMAASGTVWASASEDYDSLLFGTPRLVRGLGSRQSRGSARAAHLIDRERLLAELGVSQEELILVGLLIGTDFNDGATGYGPKKALKLVQRHLGWAETLRTAGIEPGEVEEAASIFRNPPVVEVPAPVFGEANEAELRRLLVTEHDFSEERVLAALHRVQAAPKRKATPLPTPGRQQLLDAYPAGES